MPIWKGRERKAWGKKEGVSGRNRGHWKEGLWGLIFLQNIKPSSFGELKNCIGGGFWGVWEGLYEFFNFNICYYNILKIKNILILGINLSLSKKILFEGYCNSLSNWETFSIPAYS